MKFEEKQNNFDFEKTTDNKRVERKNVWTQCCFRKSNTFLLKMKMKMKRHIK